MTRDITYPLNGHRRHEVCGMRHSHRAPPDPMKTHDVEEAAETGESDAREGWERERWDSRRCVERHYITLQVPTVAVNASEWSLSCNAVIL